MSYRQSRIWTFTINADETSGEHVSWPLCTEENPPMKFSDERVQGYHFQLEQGSKTGHVHIQGFIVFKNRLRLKSVKKIVGDRAHLEAARGTWKENLTYCSKSETRIAGPWSFGDVELPQRSSDYHTCIDSILKGKTLYELAPLYPDQICAHSRQFEALSRYLIQPAPQWRVITCVWRYGVRDTDKTRSCFEQCPELYKVNDDAHWWDGYLNQDAILFDEFDGTIPVSHMQHYLDGYRHKLQVKGGFVDAHWTKIFITSNDPPESYYLGASQEVRLAFMRRIHYIYFHKSREEIVLKKSPHI